VTPPRRSACFVRPRQHRRPCREQPALARRKIDRVRNPFSAIASRFGVFKTGDLVPSVLSANLVICHDQKMFGRVLDSASVNAESREHEK